MTRHTGTRSRHFGGLIGALSLALGLFACEDTRDVSGGLGGPFMPGGGSEDGDDTDQDTAPDGANDDGADDGEDSDDDAGTDEPTGDDGDGGDSGDDGNTAGDDGGDTDPGGGDAGGEDPYDADRDWCVELINERRATIGRAPLTRWTGREAEDCADGQAKTDSLEGGGAHSEFGKCGEGLQNEGCWAGDISGLEKIMDGMWGEGPGGGHYEAMANPNVTEVLCGFYQSTTGQYAGWWSSVQDFR